MESFLLMVSYFTRLPVGKHVAYSDEKFRKGLKYYTLVGLIIGLTVALPRIIFEGLHVYVITEVTGLIMLLLYLWATGGIHIDGFSDSLDGLYSGREKEKILLIMKDSRIGAFGGLGMMVLILTYYALLPVVPIYVVILMPIVGKGAAIYGASVSRYARNNGMGFDFITYMKPTYNLTTLMILLVLALVMKDWKILLACAGVFLVVEGMIRSIESKIQGMTGDTVGYLVELSQMTFLLIYAAIMYM